MSLEGTICEEISRFENCARKSLGLMMIAGLSFCNSVCHSEWAWKREQERRNEK